MQTLKIAGFLHSDADECQRRASSNLVKTCNEETVGRLLCWWFARQVSKKEGALLVLTNPLESAAFSHEEKVTGIFDWRPSQGIVV